MANQLMELGKPMLKRFKSNPVLFAEKVLAIKTLEGYQKECLIMMAGARKWIIPACHDVGKTYILAIYLLWAIYCFDSTSVITTAPNFSMVKNILWAEIRRMWKRSPVALGGSLLKTKIDIDGEKWFALGISPRQESEEGSGSSFQGYHNKRVHILFDEATGVGTDRWKSMRSMLTSTNTTFGAIGNPTNPSGDFKEACEDPSFTKIELSCFDSPNLKANHIFKMEDIRQEGEKLSALVHGDREERMARYKNPAIELLSLQWVMEIYMEEGEDSPYFQSRVLGVFPKESPYSIVSYSQVQDVMLMDPKPSLLKGPVVIGADTARFGDDSTVIYILKGAVQIHKEKMSKEGTAPVKDKILYLIKKHKAQFCGIDDTGLAGVADMVIDAEPECNVYRFYGSGASTDPDRYWNRRAEAYDLLGKDIKHRELKLMEDRKILSQLPVIRYQFKNAKVKIEPKEDIKKRIKQSPDEADALAIANYVRHFGMTGDDIFHEEEYGDTIDT